MKTSVISTATYKSKNFVAIIKELRHGLHNCILYTKEDFLSYREKELAQSFNINSFKLKVSKIKGAKQLAKQF